jgi:hypothetical protein
MKTISDVEFASYLLRAKQKLDIPDAPVDPLSQVVVEKADEKGLKRGRRSVATSTSNKAPRLEEDVVDVDGDDVSEKVPPPPVKGGRSSRHRSSDTTKPAELQGDVTDSVALCNTPFFKGPKVGTYLFYFFKTEQSAHTNCESRH